jgi:hypothetical protein
MAYNYSSDIADAKKEIKEFGQVVTWRRPTGTSSGSEPWKGSTNTETTYSVDFLWIPLNTKTLRAYEYFDKDDDYGEVTQSMRRGLLAGDQAFEPQLSDLIETPDGKIYNVMFIEPVALNGEAVIYKVSVRG